MIHEILFPVEQIKLVRSDYYFVISINQLLQLGTKKNGLFAQKSNSAKFLQWEIFELISRFLFISYKNYPKIYRYRTGTHQFDFFCTPTILISSTLSAAHNSVLRVFDPPTLFRPKPYFVFFGQTLLRPKLYSDLCFSANKQSRFDKSSK